MFSPAHILLILLTVIIVPLLCKLILSGGPKCLDYTLKVIALVSVFFDPLYWLWEWKTFGRFNYAYTLPLYLCSLFWILLPPAVFLKPGKLKQILLANLSTVGLISGIFGFVFNYHIRVWGICSFVGIRTLLYHFLMIFVAVLLWQSKYYTPKAGDQWRAFIPVWILLAVDLVVHQLYGYDYGYTAGGQGTAFTILSDVLPMPLFLFVVYGTFFLGVWLIFYRKLPFFERKDQDKGDHKLP
jgi:hypothetical protein